MMEEWSSYVELDPREDGEARQKYQKMRKIGEGTYAVVYLVRHVDTGEVFAMKKVKKIPGASGLDLAAIREIKALSRLEHPNIIKMSHVFLSKEQIHMILEFCRWDLEIIIKTRDIVFMPGDIKSWMLMILRAVAHCHENWVLHRDIKPSNMLISEDGRLHLADFGLASEYAQVGVPLSPNVVTRWYKAPELLFGSTHYTHAVDMWAVGCVFAELMLRRPYLPGDSDLDQLKKMCQALGTPSRETWPDIVSLPDYLELPVYPPSPLHLQFGAASLEALDLPTKLFSYPPLQRPTARQALEHPYFKVDPAPTRSESLPCPN